MLSSAVDSCASVSGVDGASESLASSLAAEVAMLSPLERGLTVLNCAFIFGDMLRSCWLPVGSLGIGLSG